MSILKNYTLLEFINSFFPGKIYSLLRRLNCFQKAEYLSIVVYGRSWLSSCCLHVGRMAEINPRGLPEINPRGQWGVGGANLFERL